MSRTVIAAVVAVVIATLTAIAFFVASSTFDSRLKSNSKDQLRRAHQVVQNLTQLEVIDVGNKAENLAAYAEFAEALRPNVDTAQRQSLARKGFLKFTSKTPKDPAQPDEPTPNLIALVNIQGDVIAMKDIEPGSITKTMWKNDKPDPANDTTSPTIIPSLNVVLSNRRVIIGDIWVDHDKMFRIGVAPVIDTSPEAYNAKDPESAVILGAIVVTYGESKEEAQKDHGSLGAEVAYYDKGKTIVTSFVRTGTAEEDISKTQQLNDLISSKDKQPPTVQEGVRDPVKVSVDGADYYAAAVPMPIYRSKALPANYAKMTAGAMVLAPIAEAGNTGLVVRLFIVLVGAGALAIALLGLYLSHRRLIAQVDQIEVGVTDIINGNLDRTFRPVGAELDGLANGLNVMMARLLGRPEPGEEEFDEEGNPIMPGRVEFEEGEDKPAADPDLAALAQESEPDYYKRVYTEYQVARKAAGNSDDGSFENFIAKLKVNEGKLKAQYQCRAVRFRVVTKDGKVSLKPVPIFA